MCTSVIVVGTGPSWEEELLSAAGKHPAADVMVVNAAIASSPVPATHAVSKHPDMMPAWLEEYKNKYSEYPSTITTIQLGDNLNEIKRKYDLKSSMFKEPWMSMTSGMYAVKVALSKGYDTIVLAGLPLDFPSLDQKAMRNYLTMVKKEFKNIEVPEYYWWKKFVSEIDDAS